MKKYKAFYKIKLPLLLMCLLILTGVLFSACKVTHEYTLTTAYLKEPTFGTLGLPTQCLELNIDEGEFRIATTDNNVADNMVNAQVDLLAHLRENGIVVKLLTYYVSDYKRSFGDSGNGIVYMSFDCLNTYMQVLATLQGLWGDYTNYGYLYAVSNDIAKQLGWTTDSTTDFSDAELKGYFSQNTDALNLTYPCFTTDYATDQTINYCKALSNKLIDSIGWQQNLCKSVEQQLSMFYESIDNFAQQLDVEYSRNTYLYAYYGYNIPLKIKLDNVEIQVENEHVDSATGIDDYWKDYTAIFDTVDRINSEINTALQQFGLLDTAELVTLKMYSANTAQSMFGSKVYNAYYQSSRTICATTLMGYLHEYYHHIEYYLNPNLGHVWQSQAFCELGRAYSYFSQSIESSVFYNDTRWADLFLEYFGHEYQGTMDDYFLVYDMYCYLANEYQLDYYYGRNAINSFSYYLVKLYGEQPTNDILLFPDTVTQVVGKTWDQLYSEWYQQMEQRFSDLQIPDWVQAL